MTVPASPPAPAPDLIRPDAPELATMSLADIAKALAEKRLPPVEKWNPSHCGDSDMVIKRDGTWFHMGTPIGRRAMVNLFSTVLRREADGRHVLVTPVEKLDIAVEDAAFVAIELNSQGEGPARMLTFRLNTDDLVCVGPENPLRFEIEADGTPRPYLHVRGPLDRPLEALINRSCFYQMVELAMAEQETGGQDMAGSQAEPILGLWSGGQFFAFTG